MKGISLELKRDATLIEWTIKRGLPPKKVRIPLSLTGEKTSRSVVCNGQRVEIGQKIAEADGEGSVAVHASLAGRVSAIGLFPHAEFGIRGRKRRSPAGGSRRGRMAEQPG